jgi:hypothetical protein
MAETSLQPNLEENGKWKPVRLRSAMTTKGVPVEGGPLEIADLLEAINETGVETSWLDFPLGEPEAKDEALEGRDDGAECDLTTDTDEIKDTVNGGLEDTTTLGEEKALDTWEAIDEPALLREDFGPDVLAGEDAKKESVNSHGRRYLDQ